MPRGLLRFHQSGQSHFLTFAKRLRSPKRGLGIGFVLAKARPQHAGCAGVHGIALRYLHRNPVKRGLMKEEGDRKWSSFRHYALREIEVVEIESE
jgi:hypothetical protein